MNKQLFFIAALFILNINLLHAEKLATVLRGKIIASNLSNIQVMIKESDGSILDMTDIHKTTGNFNLDLTIMDTPSLGEVKKLIVEVKSKSGKKDFKLNQYLVEFNDTVKLNPIILE